jgi:hypothetical protein
MRVAGFAEDSADVYRSARLNMHGNLNIQQHLLKNRKFYRRFHSAHITSAVHYLFLHLCGFLCVMFLFSQEQAMFQLSPNFS